MSGINLEKSINKLKKCYSGKNEEGQHVIDHRRLSDDLAFKFAIFRVNLAIKNNEITEEEFINKLTEENNEG